LVSLTLASRCLKDNGKNSCNNWTKFMWMFACYEEILKQKTKALPCQS
jgi:hypothetical protein